MSFGIDTKSCYDLLLQIRTLSFEINKKVDYMAREVAADSGDRADDFSTTIQALDSRIKRLESAFLGIAGALKDY